MSGRLLVDKHVKFIQTFTNDHTGFEYTMSEHLRVNGLQWCLTSMHLLGRPDMLDQDSLVELVASCKHESTGAYGASHGHDPALTSTLCAVQVMTTLDETDKLDKDKIAAFVASLQMPDGSFAGDLTKLEVDTRFSISACACLALIDRLSVIDKEKAVEYICRCRNFDGGFGRIVGSESHGAQVFCCVGALSILGALHRVNRDQLCWWLCERQTPSGGFNGRPEKLPDVCYSWWIFSIMCVMGRQHWIDTKALQAFILRAQDEDDGGIADRQGDMPDPFHTLYGCAALSLLGHPDVACKVDPVFCMPQDVVVRAGCATVVSHRDD